ncbi:molybdenum cofactor guanylyltransferase [Saccharopolyspora rosea]|uniref:Molybdenum cofactor guanylyltransferase n=1 Tax=Saccharopolyspora rosea TaxID=524884 RepID=A0ABW3FSJ7_9PSEU|nr:NTP transferase domain-containing protein [Saccharopolyspora rosea]
MTVAFAAVVLAGGSARRLGGVDKLLLPVAGRTLLQSALDAVSGADPVVAVGPPRAVDAPVVWTREDPPGGGPLAGIDAGLRALPATTSLVAVLAGDHPDVTATTVARLRAAVADAPRAVGAVLTDGVPQWLVGVWRVDALLRAMPSQPVGLPVRSALAPLDPVLVPATGFEASDVDTPRDLRDARTRA